MDSHSQSLHNMTAAWLLPIVAPIVSAGSGAIVGNILPDPNDQLITLFVSYILWGMSLSLSLVVMVIYFLRLTTKRLVGKEVVVSTFLPLGPCGFGGFAIQELGNLARITFYKTNSLPATHVYAGDILYVAGKFTQSQKDILTICLPDCVLSIRIVMAVISTTYFLLFCCSISRYLLTLPYVYRLAHRSYSMGLRLNLAVPCCVRDMAYVKIPFQYGLVGLYFSSG